MTQFIGTNLPPDLLERFTPENLPHYAHKVVLIVTVGEDGYAHPAMLSHFEIVARDARILRLATYCDSRTTSNVRRTGRLTVLVIDEGTAYYVQGHVEEIKPHMTAAPYNTLLELRVEKVMADHADAAREGDARITGGITYADSHLNEKIARAGVVFAEMLM